MSAQTSRKPLVSIGVPVFNEARFIEKTLQSLCAQDYGCIEIIISDNASSDETADICQRFAAVDSRIKFFRAEINLGLAVNSKKVFSLAQGEYFFWASGHDIWSANFVSECVQLLEEHSNAVLAYSTSTWIDEYDEIMPVDISYYDTRGIAPAARFFTVFWGNMHPMFGIFRMNALKMLPWYSCAGADLLLLSRLALMGDFIHTGKALLKRREFRHERKYTEKLKRYKSREFGLSTSLFDRFFPLARLPISLVGIVLQGKLPWLDKLGLLIALIATLPIRYLTGRSHP